MTGATPRRVAIVAGGGRGIGAEIARRLAAGGVDVVIGYVQDTVAAEKLAGEISGAASGAAGGTPGGTGNGAGGGSGRALAVRADIARTDDVVLLFDAAEAAYGRVDIVVCSAGAHAARRGPIADTDDDDFHRVVDVNLRGTFHLLRAAANRVRPGGRVITFSSSALALGAPGQALYNAAKSAVEVLTRQLAKELAGRDITVNAIAPGPTGTELFLSGRPPEAIEALAAQIPLGRIGRPEDIAAVVEFLAGEDGGWINGQVVRANGGIV
ncbi:SDR family oxidoreductase [Streptomyces sp. NPDC093085]|uniref:SDR family oxidoreductase n=1 Tax=Streptomyces sp. NPDC093085 TaxID=3155068 RepID=UPI00342F3548